jgi:hypothetical protein
MLVRRHRGMAQRRAVGLRQVRCRGSPAVLQERFAVVPPKNPPAPQGLRAQAAAERLRLAWTQAVAPLPALVTGQVSAPGALYSPVWRERSAAVPPKNPPAPQGLRTRAAAERSHLA